jgi:uncharacterized membrane protein
MLNKALAGLIGLVALSTGVAIAIIALAFALYFALEPPLGRAGAAAIVALAFIVVLLLIAILIAMRGKARRREDEDHGLIEKLLGIARERPLLAVGAAIAAGVLAVRNPAVIAAVLAAFVQRPKGKR